MTNVTKVDPELAVWNTVLAYLDNLTPGSGLENPAAAIDQNAAFDFNALRTMARLQLTGGIGGRKWYDTVQDNFGLDQVHDKKLAYDTGIRAGTSDFTLGGVLSGVLVDATMLPSGGPTIAVGPSSAEDGGYIAADEAAFTVVGVLGVGLSTALDASGILLNRCSIVVDSTNEAPTKAGTGEDIFGLLQVISGTGDGAAVAAAASENLQISFAYIDQATDLITAITLPAASYHFATRRLSSFYAAPVGLVLGGAGLPEAVNPGASFPKLPFREFDVSGTAPAANDPMTITTGTFVTAGAQTTVASFDTPALPATGAAFRDDPRIKVWVNGQKLSKGADGTANRDVYWVSTTQISFEEKLKTGKTVIHLESPSSF